MMIFFSGEIGHFLFRNYLQSIPEVQRMVITSTLILLTYGMQIITLIIICTNSVHLLAPNFVTVTLVTYPDEICFVLSLGDYLGTLPLSLLSIVLALARTLKKLSPLIYNTMNHDLIFLCLKVLVPIISLLTFACQMLVCQHSCRYNLMISYFMEVSVLSNYNYTADYLKSKISNNAKCWIPFSDLAILFSLLLIVLCIMVVTMFFCRTKRDPTITNDISVNYDRKPKKFYANNELRESNSPEENEEEHHTNIFDAIQYASTIQIISDSCQDNPVEPQLPEQKSLIASNISRIIYHLPEVSIVSMMVFAMLVFYVTSETQNWIGIIIRKVIFLLFCFSPWIFILYFREIRNRLKRQIENIKW